MCEETLQNISIPMLYGIYTSSNPIEAQYYSAKLVKLSPVCYWCGAPEETLVHNERVIEFQCQFQIVRPICFPCLSESK